MTTLNVQRFSTLAAAGMGLALSGCAGFFTGYDAESQFKCKAPPGVQCQSISGVYANSQGGGSVASPPTTIAGGRAASAAAVGTLPLPAARNMGEGQPPTYSGAIRSEPTTLRTWVMAYKDTDGDIVDQTYVYMALDSGHWMIEHAEQLVRESYAPPRPVRALGAGLPSASTGAPARAAPNETANERSTDAAGLAAGKPPADGANAQDPAAIVQRIQEAMRRASAAPATAPAPSSPAADEPAVPAPR